MSKTIDISGKRFGRLVVIEKSHGGKNSCWKCVCDCGKYTVVGLPDLKDGTKSCGCLKREKDIAGGPNKKHGFCRFAEYRIWSSMIRRCTNPKSKRYHRYGGRGIRVCDRWLKSFKSFVDDMDQRPSAKYSIDRIDNDGNYEPSNCRWATQKEQQRNRSDNHFVTAFGETKTLAEWSERSGISRGTIWNRIYKSGWNVERSLSTK